MHGIDLEPRTLGASVYTRAYGPWARVGDVPRRRCLYEVKYSCIVTRKLRLIVWFARLSGVGVAAGTPGPCCTAYHC